MIEPQKERFVVIDKASVRPNKIVFYKQFIKKNTSLDPVPVFSKSAAKTISDKQIDLFAPPVRQKFEELVSQEETIITTPKAVTACNQHGFELSKKATGRIKEKVSWLYELAKIKTVTPSRGKTVYSFKMNFITLTLPALQAHTTAEITSNCLNQFFTECKSKFGLANYVWRLEFQSNGNVHYHIATDTYVDYVDCKLIWNRCLRKLGYVARYQERFQNMSFEQYRNEFSNGGKVSFEVLRERYGRGCATNWDSPNTVDVRAVSNAKNIAFYISKYITKNSPEGLNPLVLAREPETTNLRLWFCSKSLSALEKIELFLEEYDNLVDKCLSGIQSAKKFIYDYCVVWYFNAKEQEHEVKRSLWQLYRRYATSRGYVPAG